MEPAKPGAYARAMEKRGPGLHHIAIDVVDLELFIDGLSGSGWYLHPKSLRSIKDLRTAWLSRPGTAMLIEVYEKQSLSNDQSFISKIVIPLSERERRMIAILGAPEIEASNDYRTWFTVSETTVALDEVLG